MSADDGAGATKASSNRLATIGVADLDAALRFYRDVIGLRAGREGTWSGPEFEDYYALPPGANGRFAVLSSAGRVTGRLMLVEFRDAGERLGRDNPIWFLGYNNVNFYTPDMAAARRTLSALGYEFWTEPLDYDIGGTEGSPVEVFFDGPDGLPVNLIVPKGDPETIVGRVAELYRELGPTSTGFSELSTSGHTVSDIDAALRFYTEVLGQRVLMDFEVSGADRNGFLRLPEGAVSRNVFLYGDDLMGKIALCQALNHEIPALPDEARRPPAIGYLAMAFVTGDLDAVLARAAALGVEVAAPARTLEHPGFGRCTAALLRVPGSGALAEVVQHL